jgi:hypothetical protein
LPAQSDREHRSDYANTQGMAAELSRRTDGYWTDLPYSPGRYRADSPAQWGVTKAGITAARYKLSGSELRLSVWVTGALTAASNSLYIQLPERLQVRAGAGSIGLAFLTAILSTTCILRAFPGKRAVQLTRIDFLQWPVTDVQVIGQLVIEVEEF